MSLTFADQSWGVGGFGRIGAVGKFPAIFNFRG